MDCTYVSLSLILFCLNPQSKELFIMSSLQGLVGSGWLQSNPKIAIKPPSMCFSPPTPPLTFTHTLSYPLLNLFPFNYSTLLTHFSDLNSLSTLSLNPPLHSYLPLHFTSYFNPLHFLLPLTSPPLPFTPLYFLLHFRQIPSLLLSFPPLHFPSPAIPSPILTSSLPSPSLPPSFLPFTSLHFPSHSLHSPILTSSLPSPSLPPVLPSPSLPLKLTPLHSLLHSFSLLHLFLSSSLLPYTLFTPHLHSLYSFLCLSSLPVLFLPFIFTPFTPPHFIFTSSLYSLLTLSSLPLLLPPLIFNPSSPSRKPSFHSPPLHINPSPNFYL